MFDIQVNERGQITIPKPLRDKVHIHPNENLKIDVDEYGRLVLYKKDLIDDLEDLTERLPAKAGRFYQSAESRRFRLKPAQRPMAKAI